MATFAKVHGLAQTVAALRALPAQFASKNGGPIRSALFMAARPMRNDAQARAPVDSGNLRLNVYLWRDRNPQASGATERYLISVRSKRGRAGRAAKGRLNRGLLRVGRNFAIRGDAWYGRLVEFGTEKMRAQPFMRPAFEGGKQRVVTDFGNGLRKGVDAAVERARRAAGA